MGTSMRNWRGRIGLISPDDAVNDDEYWLYPPDGVNLFMTRFTTPKAVEDIAPDMVDAYGAPEVLARAAETLKITRPSAAVFACTSCSFIRGRGHDLKQAQTIARVLGCPATTVSTAMVAAVRAFGATRVAMGAPYPESVTAQFAHFLDQHGIAVTRWKALGMTTEWQIGNSPPWTWAELARAVDTPDAQLVVISCTGIRMAEVLTDIEADLGKPVIAAPQAMLWHPMQLAAIDCTRPDRGRLFAEHGAAYRHHPEAVRVAAPD